MKKSYSRLALSSETLCLLALAPLDTATAKGGAYQIVVSEVTQSNCQSPCQSLHIGVCQVLTEDHCGSAFEIEYRVR